MRRSEIISLIINGVFKISKQQCLLSTEEGSELLSILEDAGMQPPAKSTYYFYTMGGEKMGKIEDDYSWDDSEGDNK